MPANAEAPLGPNFNAVLISPPEAPSDVAFNPPEAVSAPGQPPVIIGRAQWGADEAMTCGSTVYDNGVRAAVVHHTAGSNDYAPEDSAGIIRSIYEYHTRTLGWCDIAYNALVDKYGQVFEGRAGGIDRPVEGAHTGGFNENTWGVAMIGDFETVPPTPVQLRTTGRLLGWRLGLDHVDPLGNVALTSAGGSFTHFAGGSPPTLPTIFTHRDVGNTECPGDAAYAQMGLLRDIAAQLQRPVRTQDAGRLAARRRDLRQVGGHGRARPARWARPPHPRRPATAAARYATFANGAMYWSPESGAEPVTGAIYEAWGELGFERGALGLPTSGEIQEPQWIVQNFQHGTLNFDREKGTVTRVIDGVPLELPPSLSGGRPVQLERFTPIDQGLTPGPLAPLAVKATNVPARGPARRRCWARDLVRGRHRLRDGVAHRHAEPRPPDHRHVVGHVAERHHVLCGDAQRARHLLDAGRLADAQRHHLDEPVVGGVGDVPLDPNVFGQRRRHVTAAWRPACGSAA